MGVLLAIAILAGGWFVVAFSNMLTINMLHNHWWAVIPTIDYSSSLAITFFPYIFALLWAFIGQAVKGNG